MKRRNDGPDQGALTCLREFEAACRARDLDTGRLKFAQDAVAFGIWAMAVRGLDNIEREQWRNVWPRIRAFTFESNPDVRTDGDTAWIAAGWRSGRACTHTTRPIKISDSGRIRNELQTMLRQALEHVGERIRVRLELVDEKVMPREKQAVIRTVVECYKATHPVWFEWLDVE